MGMLRHITNLVILPWTWREFAPQRCGGPHPGVHVGTPYPHGGLAGLSQGQGGNQLPGMREAKKRPGSGEVINKAGSREEVRGHKIGQALRHLWDLDVLKGSSPGPGHQGRPLISRERATRVGL